MTSDLTAPPGYWQRETSHYPKPLTPLGSDLLLESINASFVKVFEEFGLPLEGIEFREIGGYVYQRVKPLGAGDSGGTRLPPKFVLWLALRLHPAFRRRGARVKESMRDRLDKAYVERWHNEWRPQLVKDIEKWRDVDLSAPSDDELADHLERLWAWLQEAIDVHFYLSVTSLPIISMIFFCRDHLGYDEGQVLPLLSGLSGTSSEPAMALAHLAGRIRADGELAQAVLAAAPESLPALLAERSREVAAAFAEYLHRYGCRALRYELVEECLSERPELIAGLLQDQLRRPADLAAEQARLSATREEAKAAALAALPTEALRREFDELLADAQRAYPVREDNEFYTVSVPLALARFGVLEGGRRLVARGVLTGSDDVFFLRSDEVIAALRGQNTEWQPIVGERRQQRAAADVFDPPASYGEEPPQPPLDVFPTDMRTALEALLYATEKVFEPELSNRREAAGATALKGVAAAKGSYTGAARVIMGEEQFDKLQPGDVLVCPITSPVWSILFAKVGALVTDSGGILSHPAIIAREHGIPAVVATGNATGIIRDGQQVTVDGSAGTVSIVQ